MKQLFLTSEVSGVAEDIRKKITAKNGTLKTAYITTPLEKGCENDSLDWSKQNRVSMEKAGFATFTYSITGKKLEELKQDLGNADVVHVEGGSLVHMVNQVRISGFDIFIREFIEKGGIYIGTSTGSFIVAKDTAPGLSLETYLEDGFDPKGMGLVNFLVMPHWGTDTFKESYSKMPQYAYHMKVPMIILTDIQYIWVKDDAIQIIDVPVKST
ncbi:MAG: Type 1 glutamine amidotransferase-like domain-containing protein [Candidatus Liptonbacteria bacterium]|nr:Type 1 glutamine amidotransferase-like domain-containing protein [Candidatus Liptonbacteria bacterium]